MMTVHGPDTSNPARVVFICPDCGDRITYEPWQVECSCGLTRTDRGQLMHMPVKR